MTFFSDLWVYCISQNITKSKTNSQLFFFLKIGSLYNWILRKSLNLNWYTNIWAIFHHSFLYLNCLKKEHRFIISPVMFHVRFRTSWQNYHFLKETISSILQISFLQKSCCGCNVPSKYEQFWGIVRVLSCGWDIGTFSK